MKRIVGVALIAVCAGFGADLKTGDAVLDHYLEATGGAAAYGKIHSMVMKGMMSMAAAGIKGAITMYAAEPNKVGMVTDLAGVGKIMEGSDGVSAWSFSSIQGPQIKKGDELNDSIREALFHKETDWRTVYASATLSGSEVVDGKPTYKVLMTPKTGKPETNYYEKASGLMVRHQSVRITPMGEIPVDVSIGGYRKDCGVKLPHSVTQTVAGQKVQLDIDTIECNTELPAEAFMPPPEVKALMNKK